MGRNGNKLVGFDWINDNYDLCIFGSGPLENYLPIDGGRSVNDSSEFAEFFVERIPESNGFITKSVRDGYVRGRNGRWLNNTRQGRLIRGFERRGRVLCVDECHLGSKIEEKDTFFEELSRKYGIYKPDFRISSWAIELIKNHGSVAIISNNIRGLGSLWKEIISRPGMDPKKLGFLVRRELDKYQKLVI